MHRAKIIRDGDRRLVCLPESVAVQGEEMLLQSVGGMLVLIPDTGDFEEFTADLAEAPHIAVPSGPKGIAGSA